MPSPMPAPLSEHAAWVPQKTTAPPQQHHGPPRTSLRRLPRHARVPSPFAPIHGWWHALPEMQHRQRHSRASCSAYRRACCRAQSTTSSSPQCLRARPCPPVVDAPRSPQSRRRSFTRSFTGAAGHISFALPPRSTKRRSPDDSFPPSLASWQPPRGSERNAERAKHPIPSDRRNTTRQTKHHDSGPRGAGTYRTGCEDEELTWIFAAPDRPRNLSGRRVFFCGCGDPCR